MLALLASGTSILGSKVYGFHYVAVIHHEENVEKNMSMAVEVACWRVCLQSGLSLDGGLT